MRQWLVYSAYSAVDPKDPKHLPRYWVADNGTLIEFTSAPKDTTSSTPIFVAEALVGAGGVRRKDISFHTNLPRVFLCYSKQPPAARRRNAPLTAVWDLRRQVMKPRTTSGRCLQRRF